MKKFVFLLSLAAFLLISTAGFAFQNIEFQCGLNYLYFSDSKIKSIKSNNPDIISAQRISTISDNEQQVIFTAKKTGKADVKILTEKGEEYYSVEIKNEKVKQVGSFLQLDAPEI